MQYLFCAEHLGSPILVLTVACTIMNLMDTLQNEVVFKHRWDLKERGVEEFC